MRKPAGNVPIRAVSRRGGCGYAPPELLESRQFFSVSSSAVCSAPLNTASSSATVRQLVQHAGVTDGLSIIGDGTGQQIAVVEPYLVSDLQSRLERYDKQNGLGDPPKLTIINQGGKAVEAPDAAAAARIAADVAAVHAAAPKAEIVFIAVAGSDTAGSTPPTTGGSTGSTGGKTSHSGDHTIRTFFRRSGDPVSSSDAQAVFAAPSPTVMPRAVVAAGVEAAAPTSVASSVAAPEMTFVAQDDASVLRGSAARLTNSFSTTPFAVTQPELTATQVAENFVIRTTGRALEAVRAFVSASPVLAPGGQPIEVAAAGTKTAMPFFGKVVYNLIHINALAAFSDPASALIDESANIPLLAKPSRARAWIVTGAVLAADAAIVGYFYATRQDDAEEDEQESCRHSARRAIRPRELLFENIRDFSASV